VLYFVLFYSSNFCSPRMMQLKLHCHPHCVQSLWALQACSPTPCKYKNKSHILGTVYSLAIFLLRHNKIKWYVTQMQTHTVSTAQFGCLHMSIQMNLRGFLFIVLVCTTLIHITALWHSAAMYVMLPRSPRNRNAAWKPLVVLVCARYRKRYPLWTALPSSILLWGRVCFSVHFCDVMVVLFCDPTDLVKWLMWRSNGFAPNSASNLARQLWKHIECLMKHLVIMP